MTRVASAALIEGSPRSSTGDLSKVQSVQAPPGLPPLLRAAPSCPPAAKEEGEKRYKRLQSVLFRILPTHLAHTEIGAHRGFCCKRRFEYQEVVDARGASAKPQALHNGKKRHGCKCQQRLGCPESSRAVYVEDPPRLFLWERARQEWAALRERPRRNRRACCSPTQPRRPGSQKPARQAAQKRREAYASTRASSSRKLFGAISGPRFCRLSTHAAQSKRKPL